MAAIAVIMVAILAAIFNMVTKTREQFLSAPMLQLHTFVSNLVPTTRFWNNLHQVH